MHIQFGPDRKSFNGKKNIIIYCKNKEIKNKTKLENEINLSFITCQNQQALFQFR
jgi:hypothetical protein